VVGNFRTVAAKFIKRHPSNDTHAGHCWCWWIDVCRHLPSLLARDGGQDQTRPDENNAKDGVEVTCHASQSHLVRALIDLLTTEEAAALGGGVRDSSYR
jgi:hypothetical protein